MEKSIESIWKHGFLEDKALIAPKINNLYNQKSKHIIDKFKRMFKINLIGLVVFSIVLLPISYFSKIPMMGIVLFFVFNAIVIVNYKLFKNLKKIHNNVNTYAYLRSFNTWLTDNQNINKKLARIYYPFIPFALFSGFWF